MQPERISGGLWIWRAPHPEWRPGRAESVDDWPREVGSVLFETAEAALFIDPQLPGDREAFWEWADVRCAGRDVIVLTTIGFHSRSRAALSDRYGGASVGEGASNDLKTPLPVGVECLRLPAAGETLVWLTGPKALVTGDSLVGDGRGGLRLCPESWLDFAPEALTIEELRIALAEITAGLPVRRVLVGHGEPVLSGGRKALDRALALPSGASRPQRARRPA